MNINEVFTILSRLHSVAQVPVLKKTSVVSALYPGQFNYCLDERHWLEKHGDFINIDEDHFQKVQPAIRLADFGRYYVGREEASKHHLGSFTIGTISGGHVVSASVAGQYYQNTVTKVLLAFSMFGLDRNRLRFSYFAGGMTGRDIEASRKTNGQMQKIMVDEQIIPEDSLSVEVLRFHGINDDQLIAGDTWTNYLAINWYACVAPWGYRNEIFYQMDDGSLLDIATIEHLDTEPIVEGEGEDKVIVGTQPWRNHIVIDGFGLERMVLATRGAGTILEAMGWDVLMPRFSPKQIQAICILHRVFTDCSWLDLSRGRKKKLTPLMGMLAELSLTEIELVLRQNAQTYQVIFPDLCDGISCTLSEIKAYRQRRKLSE